MRKKIRITFDLGPVSYERLGRLQGLLENTKIGIIKQALELLERVVEAAAKGYRFALINEQGDEVPIVMVGLNIPSRGMAESEKVARLP